MAGSLRQQMEEMAQQLYTSMQQLAAGSLETPQGIWGFTQLPRHLGARLTWMPNGPSKPARDLSCALRTSYECGLSYLPRALHW
eukprot:130933-Amphidinium_carterae.1